MTQTKTQTKRKPQNQSQHLVPNELKELKQVNADTLRGIFDTTELEKELDKHYKLYEIVRGDAQTTEHIIIETLCSIKEERQRLKLEVEKVIDELWEGERKHNKHYYTDVMGHKVCVKCEVEKFREELKKRLF